MAITEKKPAFVTRDGREWPTEEEAQDWEATIEAKEKLDEARGVFEARLSGMHKTADGKRFDLSTSRDYFQIFDGYPNMPRIERISVWPYDLKTIDSDYKEPGFEISIRTGLQAGDQRRTVAISDLYCDHGKAAKALVLATEKRMKELAEDFEALKKKVVNRELLA